MKYLTLKDIEACNKSSALDNYIWNIVTPWEHLVSFCSESQFINTINSISATIAEIHRRFPVKNKNRFYIIIQEYLKESGGRAEKILLRNLNNSNRSEGILLESNKLPLTTNQFIKFPGNKLKHRYPGQLNYIIIKN